MTDDAERMEEYVRQRTKCPTKERMMIVDSGSGGGCNLIESEHRPYPKEIFLNGKELKTGLIMELQWVADMPADMKRKIDYVFLQEQCEKSLDLVTICNVHSGLHRIQGSGPRSMSR